MTRFPDDYLAISVEALLNGVWVDFGPVIHVVDDYITDEVLDVLLGRLLTDVRRLPSQDITITQGRSDESSLVEAGSVTFEVWNDDGKLTPGLLLLPDGTLNPWCPSWDEGTQIRLKVDGDILFWGEASEIKVQWPHGDLSVVEGQTIVAGVQPIVAGVPAQVGTGTLIDPGFSTVTVTASGILRRLSQRKKPLRAALTRLALHNEGAIVGYWPFEDGTDSTSLAHVLITHHNPSGTISGFAMASDSALLVGSDPLPALSKGGTGAWSVTLDGDAVEGAWCVDHWLSFPDLPTDQSSAQTILDIATTGHTVRWVLDIISEESLPFLRIRGFDSAGDLNVDHFEGDLSTLFGPMNQVGFSVTGTDTWTLEWRPVGGPSLTSISGTGAGSPGHPTRIGASYANVASNVVQGQLVVRAASLIAGWTIPADTGWQGERSAKRFRRLCREESIPFEIIGDPETSTKMGIQKSGAFLDLLDECAQSGMDILGEQRTGFGLSYRCRRSLYNQEPALVLDASLSHISGIEPVKDDQTVINDMTVQRIGGSSARLTRDDDPLLPDDEKRVYDSSVSLSLDTDRRGTLRHQAGWRLHLGENKRLRYPSVAFDFATIRVPADQIAAFKALRFGDLIRVINIAPQTTDVDLIVQGWDTTLSPKGWDGSMNCTPAEHFLVGVYGITRKSPRRCVIATPCDDTETDLIVDNTPGKPWTTDPADYPMGLIANGEQFTATACAPDSGVQTFTVTRGVNGVRRAHLAGEEVELVDAGVIGL